MNQRPEVSLELPRSLRTQITDQLRAQIRSGKWDDGYRLPPTRALAATWGMEATTVHRALATLVKEGWLQRTPGRGTFVRRREPKLTCVGVYLSGWAESEFKQAVLAAVKDELQRAGLEADLWIDPRPNAQRAEPWMPMVRAAEHREFQTVIVVGGYPECLRWLLRLPVPAVSMGGLTDTPGRVDIGLPSIADLGVPALAAQGCRSVGLIMPAYPGGIAADGTRSKWLEVCERFLERASQAGMTVKNEWLRLVRQNVVWRHTRRVQEQYGYEEFLKLWRLSNRPEGLVVYPDTTAQGVILALREQQVRVPEQLKLVLHKNEAIDLFCPMPATFLVNSERQIARALVKQAQKQFRGEPCPPVNVPCRLVAHKSNSQQPTTKPPERSQS